MSAVRNFNGRGAYPGNSDRRLGAATAELGRFAEAEELHRRALNSVHLESALRPVIATNLGAVLNVLGEPREARSLFEQAHAYYRGKFGDDDDRVRVALANIAKTYMTEARYGDAAKLFSRALRNLERSVGSTDRSTLQALKGYATAVILRKDYKRGERLWNVVYERFQQSFGPKHPATLNVLIEVAAVRAVNHSADCLPLFERAVSDTIEVLGRPHPTTITARIGLTSCLTALKRYDDAVRAGEEALLISTTQAELHFRVMEVGLLTNMGSALAAQGKYLDAEVLYRRALTTCRSLNCGPHLQMALLSHYGQTLRRLGRKAEAEAVEGRLQAVLSPDQRSLIDIRDLQQPDEAVGPAKHK